MGMGMGLIEYREREREIHILHGILLPIIYIMQ